MKTFNIILLSLFIISQTACSGDKDSTASGNSSKVAKDKLSISVEKIGNGKGWSGQDGCQAKFVYTNTMDTNVSIHVIRYEVKHTKEKFLKTGLASKRTIKANETRKIDAGFSGLTCEQITGVEVQAYTCKTESGVDCSDKVNFINTNDVNFTYKKQSIL